ncbi:MAG: hypothetical protein HYX28_04560 [Candidatus Koribacter versatilis]|uniref:Uncharacterized protein n=1 Tax=Candidatus Korobacter versatilis TaxID=658062 RepID=A0A932EP97_9BACT|nr:hypothetical protein [Candidatus Koribacter versatilis]
MTTFHLVRREGHFLKRHSLTFAVVAVLLLWVFLYSRADEKTHWGAFFGNAIADWTGVVVTVLGTKFLFEVGSAESRSPKRHWHHKLLDVMQRHSLTIFLLITGAVWLAVYLHNDAQGKWNQVVGNIVSEWTQIIGLVLLTKRLIERGPKESK